MRKLAVAALCLTSLSAFAADKIPAGSKVFIEPMDGFDTSLAAAIMKKDVPVKVVDAKDKAEYVLSGTSSTAKAGWAINYLRLAKGFSPRRSATQDNRWHPGLGLLGRQDQRLQG